MDSPATLRNTAQIVPKEHTKCPSSRRTPSSSSLSSCSSSSPGSSHSPDPNRPFRFSGVPFSWEYLPGIPKKILQNSSKKKQDSNHLLPLPPPATPPASSKKKLPSWEYLESSRKKDSTAESFCLRDPFFAALVECSKDDAEEGSRNFFNGAKVTRSLSDRFGFINLYSNSCKRTCAVSESIIYLPRSSSRTSYDLINSVPRST